MSTSAKKFFDESMKNLCDLDAIYEYLNAMNCSVNQEAILRARYVLSVSAFDTYFHTMILDELMKFYRQNDVHALRYIEVMLSDVVVSIKSEISELDKEQAISVAIRKRLSKDSFQSPKSVEHALRLIQIKNIWTKISNTSNIPRISNVSPEDIKKKLSIIILRRNKIAHESDFDYLSMSFLSIRKDDVSEVVEFLTALVKAVDSIVSERN